ncbi:hypothetical protein KKE26_05575, partial [bacterium]|nr:hypothetical protein [bacterium]
MQNKVFPDTSTQGLKDSCHVSIPLHFEFHISKESRNKYQFDDALFGLTGNVVFADFKAVRLFVGKINAHKDLQAYPESVVMPGDISAMGLIDEILHLVCSLYQEQKNQAAWEKGWEWLVNEIGEKIDSRGDAEMRRMMEKIGEEIGSRGDAENAEAEEIFSRGDAETWRMREKVGEEIDSRGDTENAEAEEIFSRGDTENAE